MVFPHFLLLPLAVGLEEYLLSFVHHILEAPMLLYCCNNVEENLATCCAGVREASGAGS